MKYKISIITVCLNSSKTIERTIKSIINQSYKNIEYIIIDGGSTDGTTEIINKYRNDIANYVSEHDTGIYNAMNKGIDIATGDIIGIVNSDDWLEPEACEIIANSIPDNTEEYIISANINFIITGKAETSKIQPIETLWYQMAVMHPGTFISRKVYEKHGKYDECLRLASDYKYLRKCFKEGVKFIQINDVVSNFACNGEGNKNIYESRLEHLRVVADDFGQNPYKQETKNFVRNFMQSACAKRFIKEQDDELRKKLNQFLNNKKIYIFGAGSRGKSFLEFIETLKIKKCFLLDNDCRKYGSIINFDNDKKYKIMNPDLLKNTEGIVIITVEGHEQEIACQIKSYNNPFISVTTMQNVYNICLDYYKDIDENLKKLFDSIINA